MKNHLSPIDLAHVTGGFGISDLMQGSWDKQAEASLPKSNDKPSTSTWAAGARNLLSGFGLK